MAINTNYIVTWTDLAKICYDAMISVCCNIDNVNNVPFRLREGNGGRITVHSINGIGIRGSKAKWNTAWYGEGANLISSVSALKVNSEWDAFLTAAGINSRSNKVLQAKEIGLLVGLYQQFLAFHLKPVYSIREVYKTVEPQELFRGTRYVPGECIPKYTLTGIDPNNVPTISDTDIVEVLRQAIYRPDVDWGMLDSISNPMVSKSFLS